MNTIDTVGPVARKGRWACGLCAVLSLLFVACTSGTPTAPIEPEQDAVQDAVENVLNIYNWDDYMDPAILDNFEGEFGVTINYETYAHNEEMLAAIQAGSVEHDIVVPTDYMVAILRREGLLAALNKANIPNMVNISSDFISPGFDPGNRYCVPYQWGTIGIGYNIQATGREIQGWADFFDPAFAGRVSLLEDMRLTMGVVLLYLGHSPNTTDAAEIAAARDFLLDHAEQVAAYAPDTGQELLAAGEVDLAFEWSGDVFLIMDDNPDIRYVIPREGSIIWTDSACILAGARHQELAEAFLNYLLRPEVGAALSNAIRYSSPNRAALPLVNKGDRDNPALYPPDDVRQRLFYMADVGSEATQLYEEAWAEVMAGRER